MVVLYPNECIIHLPSGNHMRERDEFFDEVYGEVLVDLFIEWLKTEPHETKSREFLYSSAMALGSVKEKMINFEMYGKNIPHLMEDEDERD